MKPLHCFLLIFAIIFSFSLQAQNNILSEASREQLIQKAVQLRQQENYGGAVQQLDSILAIQPADAPILLFRGDLLLQGKRFAEAAATYNRLLPLKFESTIATINLSYALFMNHQPAKALQFARRAWEENQQNSNAIVNYFNAMLWNSQTKAAAQFLAQQEGLLTAPRQLVLKARLYTSSGNYVAGLHFYDSLVTAYPDKHFVKEYAEVLMGRNELRQSANAMQKAAHLFSASEYTAYKQQLKSRLLQNAGTEFVYFSDVAQNQRIENSVWWQQGEGKKYRLRLSAGLSSIRSAQNEKTTAQFTHLNIRESWSRALSGETDLHLQFIQPAGGNGFAGLTGKQSLQYQPNSRRMFGLFYNAEILNYTASLLGKNIRSHNAGFMTHIMLSGKTGIYSQGSTGFLTDNNRQSQVFISMYHLFRTEPTLKAGLNFSAMHYKDSSIKNYFSPNQYLNSEVFADYSTALPMLSRFYFQIQAAAGMQRIEQQKWDPAFRLQTELGFRLTHLESAFKYQTSNVASNTGTGYKFNRYALSLMLKW